MTTVLQGKLEAKRNSGRPPTSYINNIKSASGLKLHEFVWKSRDRRLWLSTVASSGAPTDESGDRDRWGDLQKHIEAFNSSGLYGQKKWISLTIGLLHSVWCLDRGKKYFFKKSLKFTVCRGKNGAKTAQNHDFWVKLWFFKLLTVKSLLFLPYKIFIAFL